MNIWRQSDPNHMKKNITTQINEAGKAPGKASGNTTPQNHTKSSCDNDEQKISNGQSSK